MGDITINGPKVLWEIPVLGGLPITETMRNAWIVMLFILCLCLYLTHRMKKVPQGKQALVEKAVMAVDKLVDGSMGPNCRSFSPYIMTLLMFSFFGSVASLFFMRPVTGDLNTTLGWALMTFVLILYNNIKFHGLGNYLKGLTEPIFVMLPLNILSEAATPVSMSFRHFFTLRVVWLSQHCCWRHLKCCLMRFWASCPFRCYKSAYRVCCRCILTYLHRRCKHSSSAC